jgi:hypothetical protein
MQSLFNVDSLLIYSKLPGAQAVRIVPLAPGCTSSTGVVVCASPASCPPREEPLPHRIGTKLSTIPLSVLVVVLHVFLRDRNRSEW